MKKIPLVGDKGQMTRAEFEIVKKQARQITDPVKRNQFILAKLRVGRP